MGASVSASRQVDETKLKPDNISTVSMALDGQPNKNGKSRGDTAQMHPSPGNGTASGGDRPSGQVYPPPRGLSSNPSNSVRFNNAKQQPRSIDLNGNHFYNPSSLGKASASSSINAGDDQNNNTVQPSSRSKSSASLKVDVDKVSHKSSSYSPPLPELSSGRAHSRLSQYSIGERHDDMETTPEKGNQTGRRVGLMTGVFTIELLSVAVLAVLAYLLHFTNTFKVVERTFACSNPSLQGNVNPPYKDDIVFSHMTGDVYYFGFIFIPIGIIIVMEIIRQLTIVSLSHKASTESVIPISIRRILRFIGGYAMGILLTSILVDIIKVQTGELRPYFRNVCTNLSDFCDRNPLSVLNASAVNHYCDNSDAVRNGRLSMPSFSAAMSAYSAFFLILYLAFALPYRAFRFFRLWSTLALLLVVFFTINSGLSTYQHFIHDMIIGVLIGLFFAFYAVFIHLNAFTNQLSTSNFFGAKRTATNINSSIESGANETANSEHLFDEISHSNLFADTGKEWSWNFHIPRVHTLRQSAHNLWRKSENYFNGQRPNHLNASSASTNSPRTNAKVSNAYINPAFSGGARDENILANHLHQETRFGSNGSNGTGNGAHSFSANQRPNTLRTFGGSNS